MSELRYPATTAYKQWVWQELIRRDWTLQDLVDGMKRVDRTLTVSTGTLTQLLGDKPEPGHPLPVPVPSNSALLPAINRVLGLQPPPICDPYNPLSQIRDAFGARWAQLDENSKRAMLALLGLPER